MTNKYAEGYPGRRYYGGCEFVDMAENLAIDRAKRLFDCGSQTSSPIPAARPTRAFLALMKPGDTFMGLISMPEATSPTARRSTCPGDGSTSCPTTSARTTRRIDMDEVEASPASTNRR